VPDVGLRGLDDLVAGGLESCDAQTIELLVDLARVEPLALHLEDDRHPRRREVHPADPALSSPTST
jgi:hypothetical protein